ncbi:MAG: FMN-binding protein [Patescibacteria group bacterium]|nr:FMN-binding protein [Patescibacteria group bacterium]
MKKFFLSSVTIVLFVFYIVFQHRQTPPALRNQPSFSGSTAPWAGNPFAGGTLPAASNIKYKDGEYVGNSADAYYGSVQVKTTISGGKITNIQFLDYPQDRDTSRMINSQATPALATEAIQAQSTQVNVVSGATDTSQAFIQSLSSALAQAS